MARKKTDHLSSKTEHLLHDGNHPYRTDQPVLSVIIPVYQVEKYIRRCLESAVEQTWQNIEIIVVDDCSSQNERAVIEEFCRKDSRIKYIRHTRNRGLFQTRITGMKYASGEYFAFLDSDDHISIDYYRLLMNRITDSGADIVIGDFADEYEDGRIEYYNFDNFRFRDIELTGEQVYEGFMRQHGLWFGWHTVWNKIYRKNLWEASRPELERFSEEHGHLIMTEDIAFSAAFWMAARKVVNCHNAFYFYFHHSEQSVANRDISKFSKNLNDVSAVFCFFRDLLQKKELFERYRKDYEDFLEVYVQFWTGNADALPECDRKRGRKLVRELFGHVSERNDKDHYHYTVRSSISSFAFYEDIKKNICSEQTETVSFDVFDTLLVRPFLKPSDLFALMDRTFHSMVKTLSYVDFQKIRIRTEEALREELSMGAEEITLAAVYQRIGEIFELTREQTDALKKEEIDLELRFIRARKTGKELFELARARNKRIVCVSDMYLPGEVIERMLRKCGYEADRIYVSSDYLMTKRSGNLYRVMLQTEKIPPQRMMHIGDDWSSDVVMAKNTGMRSFHLASPVSMFKGENPGIYTGHSYHRIFGPSGKIYMGESAAEYLGIRCMLAVAADRIFDNPYTVQFHPDTDFNCDPFYMGYYLLGMHLYAVTNWIIHTAEAEKRDTVHFVSRDGFLPMKAFEILKEKRGFGTKAHYLHISRKATAALQSGSIADVESYLSSFSSFRIPIKNPIDAFSAAAREKYGRRLETLSENGFIYFGKTGGFTETMKLGKNLFTDYIDAGQAAAYNQKAKEYFQRLIRENDILFDLGYRANKEHILSSLTGHPVDCLYLYTNESRAEERARNRGFTIRTFYDHTPSAYAAARELVFSEIGPSCVGYDAENGMRPLPDPEYTEHYFNEFVLSTMQAAALDFVRDFEACFGDTDIPLLFRNFDASLPFEYFMHYSSGKDRAVLGCVTFEDDSFAGEKIRLTDEWENALVYHRLNEKIPEKEIVQSVIRSNAGDQTGAGDRQPEGTEGIYADGIFLKAYELLNRKLPIGSRKRETVKKIVSRFIH